MSANEVTALLAKLEGPEKLTRTRVAHESNVEMSFRLESKAGGRRSQ
jgi:hypothetical protein